MKSEQQQGLNNSTKMKARRYLFRAVTTHTHKKILANRNILRLNNTQPKKKKKKKKKKEKEKRIRDSKIH